MGDERWGAPDAWHEYDDERKAAVSKHQEADERRHARDETTRQVLELNHAITDTYRIWHSRRYGTAIDPRELGRFPWPIARIAAAIDEALQEKGAELSEFMTDRHALSLACDWNQRASENHYKNGFSGIR